MRSTIAMATFAALAAGTVGVSALDTNPNFAGSDTLKNMTQDVLVECGANCAGLTYIGTGSGAGQNAVVAGTQGVAPMSRAFNNGICAQTNRTHAEGVVVALDGVNVIGMDTNVCNSAAQGLDFDPATANSWRAVLRTIYTGMPGLTSTDPLARDCNSTARRALIASWNDIFRGDCNNCSDSNPDTAVTETGLRHAFRRDEESGTTDVFLGLLSLGTISFTTNEPAGYPAESHLAFRTLANSPFCNVHRPNDTYLAVTVPPNSTLAQIKAGTAKVIPPVFDVGAAPAGSGGVTLPGGTARLRSLIGDPLAADFGDDVSFPEMQDQDPVRRKCVSDNFDTLSGLVKPTEQVCSADGQLGVVLAINPPPVGNAVAYPTTICDAGAFEFGPAVLSPSFGSGMRCPNGDESLGAPAQCRLPLAPDGVHYNCLNGGGTWIASGPNVVFAANGGPAVIDGDTPGETMGQTTIDGRVYNNILRDAAGNALKILRPNPSALGNSPTPLVGSFYRIHTTRSLLAAASTKTCQRDDATEQLGCLVQASPCSLAYAGGDSVTQNPGGTIGIRVQGILPDITSIQNLITQAGPVYPFARKLYVNSLRGFDNPLAPFTGTDAETDMTRSFVTETVPADATHVGSQFGGSIPSTFGFFALPGTAGPFCEDFNENGVCGTTNAVCTDVGGGRIVCPAVNTNGCNTASTTAVGTPAQTAYCGNGVVDVGEACDDGNAITDSRTSPTDTTDDKCSVGCTITP
jgi:ABC-type phosphate transport system substrate-binding protein